MFPVILVFHIIICLSLIILVLLQRGKGTGLGGVFGGAGGQSVFGSRGATTFLSKATTYTAVVFMLTSLSLALLSAGRRASVGIIEQEMMRQQQPTAIPEPPAVPSQEPVPEAETSE